MTMRNLRTVIGTALVTVALAGCAAAATAPSADGETTVTVSTGSAGQAGTTAITTGEPSPPGTAGAPVENPPVPGQEYDGVYGVGADGAVPSVAVVLNDGSFQLTASCDGWRGSVSLADGRLQVAPYEDPPQMSGPYTDHLGTTHTATPTPEPGTQDLCGEAIAAELGSAADVLTAAPSVVLSGTDLVLSPAEGPGLILTRQEPDPDVTGRRWELADYRRAGGERISLGRDVSSWFEISEVELTGSTGCNAMSGVVLAAAAQFRNFGLGRTEKACSDEVMEVEDAVTDLLYPATDRLPGVSSYIISDGFLTVTSNEGELRYRDTGPATMSG
jgi:hypothetical protein